MKHRNCGAFGISLALVLFTLGPATAAEPQTWNVPEDFETIMAAVDSANWGDTILVGPGVYEEAILLTDKAGDGLIIKSVNGPSETTLQYSAAGNQNEAVVTIQRCSNSTQLVGFTIDGKGEARRGILTNAASKPVLAELEILNCEYGVASHRNALPYLQDIRVTGALTSGLYIQGGSADAKNCSFLGGEKFGVYIRGTGEAARFRNCKINNNGQVGFQATDGEFNFLGGEILENGDTGMILQDVSPIVSNVRIEGHANVGVVMDASSATFRGCTLKGSEFGMVISIDGAPNIFSCVFEENASYHVGIEGDANPLIGGSLRNANKFLGDPGFAIQTSSTARVIATYNFWDKPCVPTKIFQVSNGRLKRKPWAAPDLSHDSEDCTASRKYFKRWKNGKLPSQKAQEASAATRSESSAIQG